MTVPENGVADFFQKIEQTRIQAFTIDPPVRENIDGADTEIFDCTSIA